MSDKFPRRDFLIGVLATGTLSAAGTYFVPCGRIRSVALTLITGADSTGARQLLIDMWNEAHPNSPVVVKEVTGPTLDQRDQMIDAAVSGGAGILNLDTIHIPYFAHKGYLAPIEVENVNEFLPATLTASSGGTDLGPRQYWATPFNTDVGMLFERLDRKSVV